MRFALVFLVCSIVPSVASADGPKVTFVDVLNASAPGDFAAYDGQRFDGTKLVPQRVFLRVEPRIEGDLQLLWFNGEKDKEKYLLSRSVVGRAYPIDQIVEIAGLMGHARTDTLVKDITLENGTCKLAKDVPCTILRFNLDGYDIVAGMSTLVRALGIASLEIKHPTRGVMWKLQVTGYGRDKASEWGTAFPAHLVDKATGQVSFKNTPLPSIVVGEPITSGGDLDKAVVRRNLERYENTFYVCYEKELATKPQLQGVVTVKFEIQTTGKVSTASGSGVDQKLASCVAQFVKEIVFPRPSKPVSVTSTLTFKPTGG